MPLPLTFLVTWGKKMNLSFSTSSSSCPPSTCESLLVVCMGPSENLELGSVLCKVPFHLLSCEHFLPLKAILTEKKSLLQHYDTRDGEDGMAVLAV